MKLQESSRVVSADFACLATPQVLNRINSWANLAIPLPVLEEVVGRLLTNPDYRRMLNMSPKEADTLLSRYCNEQCLPEEVDFVGRRHIQLLEIMGVNPDDL